MSILPAVAPGVFSLGLKTKGFCKDAISLLIGGFTWMSMGSKNGAISRVTLQYL